MKRHPSDNVGGANGQIFGVSKAAPLDLDCVIIMTIGRQAVTGSMPVTNFAKPISMERVTEVESTQKVRDEHQSRTRGHDLFKGEGRA
jgi:hypothetical protein